MSLALFKVITVRNKTRIYGHEQTFQIESNATTLREGRIDTRARARTRACLYLLVCISRKPYKN